MCGSPPQVWGHRRDTERRQARYGFTPTSVGTSFLCRPHTPRNTVHPHKCGDISLTSVPLGNLAGSPPQVWGHHQPFRSHQGVHGFTPTSVGTSGQSLCQRSPVGVHPHKCGDITSSAASVRAGTGSPPQVWGHLYCDSQGVAETRFTPTSVGTSDLLLIYMCA